MQIETWPMDRPQPYGKNPRLNDYAVEVVAKSIREFGFRQPIFVEASVVIIGHSRLPRVLSPVGITLPASGRDFQRSPPGFGWAVQDALVAGFRANRPRSAFTNRAWVPFFYSSLSKAD